MVGPTGPAGDGLLFLTNDDVTVTNATLGVTIEFWCPEGTWWSAPMLPDDLPAAYTIVRWAGLPAEAFAGRGFIAELSRAVDDGLRWTKDDFYALCVRKPESILPG